MIEKYFHIRSLTGNTHLNLLLMVLTRGDKLGANILIYWKTIHADLGVPRDARYSTFQHRHSIDNIGIRTSLREIKKIQKIIVTVIKCITNYLEFAVLGEIQVMTIILC